jgi:hypothetical protein
VGASQVVALPAAEGAAPPSGANTFTGSFSLSQSDDGCNFSAAPGTGGTFDLVVGYDAGTASGSFSGAGEGVRQALECTGNFGDLTWSQSYTGTFSGTVDASGNLNMTGTLSGTGTGVWSNCSDFNNLPFDCPADNSGPYSYPISVTGAVPPGTGAGSGNISVSNINLSTSGTWTVSAGGASAPAGDCSWTGTWDVGWSGTSSGGATMTLLQNGDVVTGGYNYQDGTIAGTTSGLVLTGTWSEAPSHSPPDDAGPIEFTLAADCGSFSGRWGYGEAGAELTSDWSGTRIGS